MSRPFSIFFVLIICIAGYYLLNNIHRTHYSLKRSNGYHTFLSSATAGIAIYGCSIAVYAVADCLFDLFNWHFSLGDIVLNKILRFDATNKSTTLFDVCAITVVICVVYPLYLYKFKPENKRLDFLEEFAQDGESPEFTQLFFRSYEFGLPILFTMSDRKIYIGYVTEIHSKPFNDVHIIPIVSGYRHSTDLKLIPVTPYQDIIHDVENDEKKELDFEAFTVTLPLREIVYAHLHDFEKYEDFKKAEKRLDYSQDNPYQFSNKPPYSK